MNEAVRNIMTRRSIRRYDKRQITEDELNTVIQAGLFAPSAKDQQSWHFTVIQDPSTIERLESDCVRTLSLGEGAKPFYGAPTIIVVFAKRDAIDPVCDGSLALGNLFLSAHALGLGSCWINCVKRYFRTDEGKSKLTGYGVDDTYEAVGSCILGYPLESPGPKPRREGTVSYIR